MVDRVNWLRPKRLFCVLCWIAFGNLWTTAANAAYFKPITIELGLGGYATRFHQTPMNFSHTQYELLARGQILYATDLSVWEASASGYRSIHQFVIYPGTASAATIQSK